MLHDDLVLHDDFVLHVTTDPVLLWGCVLWLRSRRCLERRRARLQEEESDALDRQREQREVRSSNFILQEGKDYLDRGFSLSAGLGCIQAQGDAGRCGEAGGGSRAGCARA